MPPLHTDQAYAEELRRIREMLLTMGAKVEEMLLKDFSCSKLVDISEIEGRSWFFKIAVRVARLMAPIL